MRDRTREEGRLRGADHTRESTAVSVRNPARFKPQLEAIERSLLLFLLAVQLHHSLFERLPGSLSTNSHLPLFFHSLQTGAGIALLFPKADELVLERSTLAAPLLHVSLRPIRGGLQVYERLLKGSGELLFGEEMLLDRADAAFLLLNHLSHASTHAFLAGVTGTWR